MLTGCLVDWERSTAASGLCRDKVRTCGSTGRSILAPPVPTCTELTGRPAPHAIVAGHFVRAAPEDIPYAKKRECSRAVPGHRD